MRAVRTDAINVVVHVSVARFSTLGDDHIAEDCGGAKCSRQDLGIFRFTELHRLRLTMCARSQTVPDLLQNRSGSLCLRRNHEPIPVSMAHVVVDRTNDKILACLTGVKRKMLNIARLRTMQIIR
jgi:hypothetical protein